MANIPASMEALIKEVKDHFSDQPKLGNMFENCFVNTYETTLKPHDDGKTFVITGDIPAMWLRDSAAQVRPYLILAEKDEHFARLVEGVVRKQFEYINHDPYANAFNEEGNGKGHQADETDMTDWIWERKYEIDSLCFPVQLAYLLWKATDSTAHFDEDFKNGVRKIIDVFRVEQYHESKSPYRFVRHEDRHNDTLSRDGKGALVKEGIGMTWSGFRPSDDACTYGYLVPSNMFAVVILRYIKEIAETVLNDEQLATEASALANEIDGSIQQHAVIPHEGYKSVYAYEVDGFGQFNFMDDANVPSLLAAPYLGYCSADDETYANTRQFLLSHGNPTYYEGDVARGIGSPHTPPQYIWHIALAIQGLTATSDEEKKEILEMFKRTDADTNLMHEGFHVDDPAKFTRPWFSWANSMFSEFLLSCMGKTVKK
ncbi:glycoside hydrolase family 125 protein [Bacillaceae bacterium SIJ1]|uniref:glycoside hydrolase family 125 protein n=1 Tax=Litoribacterium kuwaitense TaxID=1398745 RepID=UPI0013EB84B7|nr:glycoside hydrolase family 125 protein [Litoribacterium kuwaitense]NGP46604.1 glycoside hydrolase family 125 protein [Litoribacterium kuwaitense]